MTPTPARLAVSQLESRDVPSTVALGDGWADPANITISFAPDGTLIGQPPAGAVDIQTTTAALTGLLGLSGLSPLVNPLTGLLNGVTGSLTSGPNSRSNANTAFGGLAGWQREILQAFQTWAAATNLNLGLVFDSGATFGTGGAFQGDSRFGDIRIGGTQLDRSALANAVVVSPGNGTWSGDVLFNTAQSFSTNGYGWGGYDLYTVALHEAGHVFGLEHSDDPASVMSESYWGVRTGLSASDLAMVRSYYGGARRADSFDSAGANDTQATATALGARGNFVLTGDRTTSTDTDWYSFTASTSGALTVKLKTSGISLLTARLSVVDASGKVVGSAVATDPTRGDLTINLSSATAGKYFLKVDSAATDAFGIGRYQLSVSGLGGETVNISAPNFGTGSTTPAAEQAVLASGTLTKSASQSQITYTMATSGLFSLSADSTSNVSGASLIVEVFDANGNKVMSFTQSGSGSGSGSAYLQAGKYTIRTTAVLPLLSWGGKVDFTLSGGVTTDPMGTAKPGTSTSPYPSSGTSPGTTSPSSPTTTAPTPTNSNTATAPYSY